MWRVALIDRVRRRQRLALHAQPVAEARLNLEQRVGHGRAPGALQQLQSRALGQYRHPVGRQDGAAQGAEQVLELQLARALQRLGAVSETEDLRHLEEENVTIGKETSGTVRKGEKNGSFKLFKSILLHVATVQRSHVKMESVG